MIQRLTFPALVHSIFWVVDARLIESRRPEQSRRDGLQEPFISVDELRHPVFNTLVPGALLSGRTILSMLCTWHSLLFQEDA